MTTTDPDHDIVVFGATGYMGALTADCYTGALTADCLARHSSGMVRQPSRGATAAKLPELRRGLPQQLPRHDEQLDLLRAFEDVEDLDVAGPFLEQLAFAVPDAPT